MDFSFIVNASVERTQGKFSSRDDIESQLIDTLDGANPGTITGENEGEYEVTDWSVEAASQPKVGKTTKLRTLHDPPPTPALAPNLVALIRATVRVDHLGDTSDEAVDALMLELRTLCERFPNITSQELAKQEAEARSGS